MYLWCVPCGFYKDVAGCRSSYYKLVESFFFHTFLLLHQIGVWAYYRWTDRKGVAEVCFTCL